MNDESRLRETICLFGRSLFDRGLTAGSSGNISVRLSDGGWLTTPTKELPLHAALYATRRDAGAIVHLHSTHSVAVSMLPDIDPANALPSMTAYYVMRVGRTALVPYYRPGDAAVAEAIRGLAGKYSAVLLANHGPVVAGKDLEAAVYATEELEETAKLRLLLHGLNPRLLTRAQVRDLVTHFNLDEAIAQELSGNSQECCSTPHDHSHKCG
jgi:ribulose-5-phosphate 4-epimerase/fuculose-1-phosphate aldolase